MSLRRLLVCLSVVGFCTALVCAIGISHDPSAPAFRTLARLELEAIFGGQNDEMCCDNYQCITTQVLCGEIGQGFCDTTTEQKLTGNSLIGCFCTSPGGHCFDSGPVVCRQDYSCVWNPDMGKCVENVQGMSYWGMTGCTDI